LSYAWDITIPANTLATAPVKRSLKVNEGVLTKVEVKFPAGQHGLVRCRISRGGVAFIAPRNPDEYVTGDDEAATWHTYEEIDEPPFELVFTGSSPGTTYAHTVTVRLEVLPKRIASMIPVIELLTRLLTRMGVFG